MVFIMGVVNLQPVNGRGNAAIGDAFSVTHCNICPTDVRLITKSAKHANINAYSNNRRSGKKLRAKKFFSENGGTEQK